MKDSLKIAIAGATGYIGIQLIKILSKHSKVKILYLCANKSVGKSIYSFDKNINKKNLPKITKIDKIIWPNIDILFTSLPNGEAQKVAKRLPKHVALIDLSGDFRLDNYKLYKKWYGVDHKCKELINKSLYSITEFSKDNLNKYKIISCPGCYPTSAQIPLIPLIEQKAISTKNIIIDSKSGYSGAGKNIKKKFNHKNLFKSVTAYGVGGHRHVAEIDQQLSKAAKKKVNVIFTPHLIPMFRGILSTIYIETRKNYNAKKIYEILKKYHKNNFFVKIAKFNKAIGTGEIMNTNFCNISVCKDIKKNRVIIISTIDNLIKGGSGQAVQNMNVAFNMKESLGLI
jgi:N-acetyl-gamma-glutamyl-phosphate reductase